MLVTASCLVPLHRGTPLQQWMVYGRALPLSSHGCQRINWNWTQIKLNSSLFGMNDSGANTIFPVELFGVQTNPSNSAPILGVIFDKHFTFCSHISIACSSGFYHIRDLPISPMKPGSVARQPNQCSTAKSRKQFRRMLKISLLANKMFHEKQPVYFTFLFVTLPFHPLKSNKGITLSVSRVKTNRGVSFSLLCSVSLGQPLTFRPFSSVSLATLRTHLQTHFFDLTIPP